MRFCLYTFTNPFERICRPYRVVEPSSLIIIWLLWHFQFLRLRAILEIELRLHNFIQYFVPQMQTCAAMEYVLLNMIQQQGWTMKAGNKEVSLRLWLLLYVYNRFKNYFNDMKSLYIRKLFWLHKAWVPYTNSLCANWKRRQRPISSAWCFFSGYRKFSD